MHQQSKLTYSIYAALFLFSATLSIPASAQNNEYQRGQQALQQGQWQQAISAFEAVANDNHADSDAALYWQAYAHYQAGQKQRAQRVIERLKRQHPNSQWLDDAAALNVQHRADAENLNVGELDDELKIYALAALMDKHPQRALPLTIKLLRTSDNPEVREQALYIIGNSDNAEGRAIIRELARDNTQPGLQQSAIYLLADDEDPQTMRELAQLYNETDDHHTKETILYALGNGEQQQLVSDILKRETDGSLQAAAVHALSSMDAANEILSLNLDRLTAEGRQAAIYAYAETESAEHRNLEKLKRFYHSSSDPELKETILYALGNNEQQDMVLELLRAETDEPLQAAAIYALRMMDATDQLRALSPQQFQGEAREALIYVYADIGALELLTQQLEHETDPQLRATIIHSISNADSEQSAETLMNLYRRNEYRDDRLAVVHAMIGREHTAQLMQLLRQEQDPEIKAQIISALANSGDSEARELIFSLLEDQ